MAIVKLAEFDMWYGERGNGPDLVMLHPGGAGVDARALEPIVDRLARSFHVYTPEQRAHGRSPDVAGPITYGRMAGDTISFIETVIRGPVYLLGYSDGAIVGLHVAKTRPDLTRRLAFVAGVFHRHGWRDRVLDDEPPDFFREAYGELSPDGIEHYDTVVSKLATMHRVEPALTSDDLSRVPTRTLIMLADDDEVRLEHAIEMYQSLADAELCVIPGTSHGLLHEKTELCTTLVDQFLSQEPVATLAPIRRACISAQRKTDHRTERT